MLKVIANDNAKEVALTLTSERAQPADEKRTRHFPADKDGVDDLGGDFKKGDYLLSMNISKASYEKLGNLGAKRAARLKSSDKIMQDLADFKKYKSEQEKEELKRFISSRG